MSVWTWNDVMEDLRGFKPYADRILAWPRMMPQSDLEPESPNRAALRALAFAGHDDASDPTRPLTGLSRWMQANDPLVENNLRALRRALGKSAYNALEASYDDEPEVRVGGVVQSMRSYVDEINGLLDQSAPEAFSYRGFRVKNPEHLWESTIKNTLDGIDYMIALFERRGVEDLLKNGLNQIIIKTQFDRPSVAGLYSSQSKTITIKATTTTAQEKMLENFMHEVFVHEFGHHVHMSYLHPEAKALWDSGWEEVESAQAALNEQISVTPADRQRFFDLIEQSGWSPQKAGRKVKGLDRLKYLMWLYKPMVNQIISTPNQVRLTDYGKTIFDFFRDPDAARAEFIEWGNSESQADRMVERKTRMYKNTLGLSSNYAGVNYPMLDEESVEKVRAEDTTVDAALDALGIPTTYGRTNVREDFAETFVLWMVHPERLSEQARNRMGRSLWLSGFYDQPVMRFAQDEENTMQPSASRLAKKWKKLPKGWTDESVKKFWKSLGSDAPKHKVWNCIEKMTGKFDNPGAFCGGLADWMDPGWRKKKEDPESRAEARKYWKGKIEKKKASAVRVASRYAEKNQ